MFYILIIAEGCHVDMGKIINFIAAMEEIIFIVEESIEGGYFAKALSLPIITEADTLDELRIMVKDAVHCHFDDPAQMPKMIRLHFVKDEVFAA
jgi:hypothetical protein